MATTRFASRWRWIAARLRISVRTLMLVVLAVAGSLGWVERRARIQREAVAAIETMPGNVLYDWEWKGRWPISRRRPIWRNRLSKWLGEDYFNTVVCVNVYGAEPRRRALSADQVLAFVSRLDRLNYFRLYGCPDVTDAEFARREALTGLRELDVDLTPPTGAGLRVVRGTRELRRSKFAGGRVTDADLHAASGRVVAE